MAASALVKSLPTSESNDSCDESHKEPSPNVSPLANSAASSKDGTTDDTTDGKALLKLRRSRMQKPKQKLKINQEGKYDSKSKMYFQALFWGILLSRLWLHWDFIVILLIPITFYALKQVLVYWSSSICSSAPSVFLLSQWNNLKSWANERKQALIPTPLSGLFKGGIKVDLTVSLYYHSQVLVHPKFYTFKKGHCHGNFSCILGQKGSQLGSTGKYHCLCTKCSYNTKIKTLINS